MTAYNIGYLAARGIFGLYTRDVLHVGAIRIRRAICKAGRDWNPRGWFDTGLIRGLSDMQVQAMSLAVPGVAWLGGWVAAGWGHFAPMITAGIVQLVTAIFIWIAGTRYRST